MFRKRRARFLSVRIGTTGTDARHRYECCSQMGHSEQDSEKALDIVSRSLIAPDLFQAEIGNVLTKKVRGREMAAAQARRGFDLILSRVSLLPSRPFGRAAFDHSLILKHSIYDCY